MTPLRDAAESATAGVPVVAWWEAPLRAAAEKATPGTWEARTMAGWVAGFEFFGGADNAFTFPLDLEQEDVDFINAAQPQNVLALLSELDTARAEIERLRGDGWTEGAPPSPWSKEWFIAETVYGERVVLTALPEEYTYDFKTADETYIMARNIKRWMPFPDSEYVSPSMSSALSPAVKEPK